MKISKAFRVNKDTDVDSAISACFITIKALTRIAWMDDKDVPYFNFKKEDNEDGLYTIELDVWDKDKSDFKRNLLNATDVDKFLNEEKAKRAIKK